MHRHTARIKRLLEVFFQATQVEALYFDCRMNASSGRYLKYAHDDFFRLSMGRVEAFIADLFKTEQAAPRSFYTYGLHHSLVCNIVLLSKDGQCCGAVVTQPVCQNAADRGNAQAHLGDILQGSPARGAYHAALRRAPFIAHSRIASMGKALSALARTAFVEEGPGQVFCGGESELTASKFFEPDGVFDCGTTASLKDRHGGYPIYLKIKDAISKGDTAALLEALGSFEAGGIHPDQQSSDDPIRSLKNSFIEGLGMACFISVEAGLLYGKARDLTEGFIKELDGLRDIGDMYRMMKSALLAFTRAVAVARIIGYSKPVRLALEYIEAHHAEKITLKMLAQEVKLSEFYLSKLIRKETGSGITDLINRARIEESKRMLLKAPVGIGELATAVGYSYGNHFSRVFKQHTGMTPSAYRQAMAASDGEDARVRNVLRVLLDQLHHASSRFPGMFDVARIIDPATRISWMMQPAGEIAQGTCYDFWKRGLSCEACISQLAVERGKSLIKLEQRGGDRFFVAAVPVTVGNKKYAIELLRGTAENFIDCTGSPAQPAAAGSAAAHGGP